MNIENAVELKNIEMHFNMSKEKVDSLKEYFLRFVTRKLMFEDFVAALFVFSEQLGVYLTLESCLVS